MANDGIDKLARTLVETLPQGLRSVRDEIEKNFRSVLQSGLGKLDLVTREEFEVQEAVLRRTREKLEALVARLEELESGTGTGHAGIKKKAKKSGTGKSGKTTSKKPAKRTTKKKAAGKKGKSGTEKKSKR